MLFDRTSYEPLLGINSHFPQIINPWLNYDGANYLNIAQFGYTSADLLVYMPLYPLFVRITSLNGLLSPVLVGLFLSFLFSICAIFSFYFLAKKDNGESVAFKSLIIFLIFPTSFFMFSFYAESLFLMITILFFWALGKEKYLQATIFVMSALVTKIFGLALLLPLIYCLYKVFKKKRYALWTVTIAPLGLLTYLYFVYLKFNNPLLVFLGQSLSRYGRHLGILSPIVVLQETALKVIKGPTGYDNIFVYPVIILEAATIIFIFLMLVITYKKIRLEYWLYCLGVALIIMFSGGLSSDLRYALVLFPFFIYLAKNLSKHYFLIWCFVSLVLLVFSCSLFLRNYWIA